MNGIQNSRASAQARNTEDDDILNVSGLVQALWNGKMWIMSAMLIAVLIGGVYAYVLATPTFKSTSVVMLNNREETVIERGSVIGGLGSSNSVLRTEAEILQSRVLLGKVVDALDLTADPEFNPSLRPQTLMQKIRGEIRGWLQGYVELPQVSYQQPETPVDDTAAPEMTLQERREWESTINVLLSHISVLNLPQSLVFEVTVESVDPVKAALIADTLVDTYILDQLDIKFQATEQATFWLTQRVSDLQIELEKTEERVKSFRAQTPLIGPESLQGLEVQVKDLRQRIESTRISLDEDKRQLEALQAAASPAEIADILNNPELDRLLLRIDTPEIRTTFDTRVRQIQNRLQIAVNSTQTQLASLQDALVLLEERSRTQSADLITLEQLTREAEANRLLYEYFLSRLKETSAQKGVQQADSRVISSATLPVFAATPRKKFILMISVVLGGILGAAFVLLREARNSAFRTPDELESKTSYQVMGQIPLIPTKQRKNTIAYLQEKPTSAAAESLRNLRTSVTLSNVDQPPQVIMVSSALPGEGKTTVALGLAQNYAAMGKKVLMVEGDVRRRIFNNYMKIDGKAGIISLLLGKSTLKEAIIYEELLGCDVLPADNSKANAADMFSSEKFAALLKELRTLYDIIVIDTAPVLIVPDARVVVQHADIAMMVVRWNVTYSEQVMNALREFESAGRPVNGLVLNSIDPRGMKRYAQGYGSYMYNSSYYNN